MGSKKLKVVHVGCGGTSGAWLDAATKDKSLEVVGLVDLRREAAEQRARDFALSPELIYDSLDEALKSAKPDVVFDVTTPESHCEVVTRALAAGCHVCGEKPLSDSMASARRMVRAAQKAGRIYAVMQNRRQLAGAVALVKMLRSGTIGPITTVNVDYYLAPRFGGFRDQMDHPLLLDMAIHTFDQARQLTGADATSAYCIEFNPTGSWYKGAASAMCIFEMTGGIIFNYRGSWSAEGYPTSWEGSWRIVGTKGTALWSEDQPTAAVVTRKVEQYREIVPPLPKLKYWGHTGIIREFLAAVRAGRTPQTVCTDNIKSLAMVFGAIKSAQTGRRVKIEPMQGLD